MAFSTEQKAYSWIHLIIKAIETDLDGNCDSSGPESREGKRDEEGQGIRGRKGQGTGGREGEWESFTH